MAHHRVNLLGALFPKAILSEIAPAVTFSHLFHFGMQTSFVPHSNKYTVCIYGCFQLLGPENLLKSPYARATPVTFKAPAIQAQDLDLKTR